jgi:hypothetical protein
LGHVYERGAVGVSVYGAGAEKLRMVESIEQLGAYFQSIGR